MTHPGVRAAAEPLGGGAPPGRAVAGARAQTGKLTEEEVTAILERITFTTELGAMEGCDIVIEAIAERLTDKVELFEKLDAIAPEHAILASNTSSLPIIEIARATGRADRVIGTHFFNPPPVMKLLELVRSIATSETTLAGDP